MQVPTLYYRIFRASGSEKSQPIFTSLYFLSYTLFCTCYLSPFSSFNDEARDKHYKKRSTTRNSDNVKSHDQEERLSSIEQ